jgi:tetratricopeptide (TPR) repeat protein
VPGYAIALYTIPLPIFAALMTLTLGTIFRIGWGAALATTLLSFLSLFIMPVALQTFRFVCASPFLLLLLIFLLRDRIGEVMSAQRARQSFKQNLEAATLNPADASAHYNLGFIYQQRGELDAAAASFRRAIEIDPQDADSHYQLGRIAREQGRLSEAIAHFETVVRLAPTHSQHEIWREIALVYFAAGQYQDALEMLNRFLAERPSDAQARYWRGLTLANLGRADEATQEMQSCIESVRTAPAYKYRSERRWLQLAQNFLRERQA